MGNFLDVGGASTVATMTAAFKIIGTDPNVKCIFVNIFGGIARCDNIATAVVAGVKATGTTKPLVVRLEGTNVEAVMKIIKESGIDAFLTNDFTEGAKKSGGSRQCAMNSNEKLPIKQVSAEDLRTCSAE